MATNYQEAASRATAAAAAGASRRYDNDLAEQFCYFSS